MDIRFVDQENPAVQILHSSLGEQTPQRLAYLGNLEILQQPLTALFCSVSCPGSLILKAYDLAQQLGEAKIPVISGFHSPVEQDALKVLLRGEGALVICLARGLEGMRLPKEYVPLLKDGRLLLVSGFAAAARRPTEKMTALRNKIAGALAEKIILIHATADGKLGSLCQEFIQWGKAVFCLEDEANRHLIEAGVRAVEMGRLAAQRV